MPSVPGAPCSPSTPLRSSPEQKPRPAPVRITARTSRSVLIRSNVVVQLRDESLTQGVEPLGAVHRDEEDPGFELLGEHQRHQAGPSSPATTKSTSNLGAGRQLRGQLHHGAARCGRRRAQTDDDRLDRERETGVEHVLRQCGHRVAGETLPVALLSRVLRHEVERGRTVEPERMHQIDPSLCRGPFGLHEADVGVHEGSDHVAQRRRFRGAPQGAERGAATGRQIPGAPRDHRADEAVSGTEVVVDGGAVLARGVGDVPYRDPQALGEEELLGDVEQLRLGARRRAPIGLQAPHGLHPIGGSCQCSNTV